MTVAALINRACTLHIVTGTTIDGNGQEVPTVDDVVTTCELQQRRRDEDESQGELSETNWTLFLPADTTFKTGDSVTVDGDDYEAIGDSWNVRNPRTQQTSHVECSVRRAG